MAERDSEMYQYNRMTDNISTVNASNFLPLPVRGTSDGIISLPADHSDRTIRVLQDSIVILSHLHKDPVTQFYLVRQGAFMTVREHFYRHEKKVS